MPAWFTAFLSAFDLAARHWDHLRVFNPTEGVFATVRHRTVRTKDTLSQETAASFLLQHAKAPRCS